MGIGDFLGALGDQLADQFSLGENSTHSLDAVIDGQEVKYGVLGDFASKFDQSAERRYLEQGYMRQDPYTALPKQLEILMQEPTSTVLVKKRMFSSIANNYSPSYMDSDEKLYFRALKILMQNKCRQIAILEKLSKIQKVTSIVGQMDNYFIPIMITLMEELNDSGFTEGNLEGNKAIRLGDKLKRIYGYNTASPHTSWITDSLNLVKSQYAEGTGVIEFTNFTNLVTNTSINMDGGSASFTIHDPYSAMLITEFDIERAIADATNVFYLSKTFQTGKENITVLIDELQTRLNNLRKVRGASRITFRINPNTLLGRRVTAVIDGIGETIKFDYNALAALTGGISGSGVEVAPEYLKGGAIAGVEGLSEEGIQSYDGFYELKKVYPESELNIFQRLIKAIFDRMTLTANSTNALQTSNKKTNYTRRKLRFNFLGKLLIQPMDVVHVYMGSRSQYDRSLLGGLASTFNGLGVLQTASKSLTDLTNAFNAVFNPNTDPVFQIEKAAFVGVDFPNTMWAALRNQFVDEKGGAHVFGGIVSTASDNWSEGKYSVSVQCKDNTTFFDMGKINFNPGVDVFNGRMFDPLTPFKSKFDSITSNVKNETPELLEDNKFLLSEAGESALAKHKSGPSVGQPITYETIIQDKTVDPQSGLLTRAFYAPDGLVYKWKEGIGVLVQFGSSLDINGPDTVGITTIYKDPFAGQDVMNVISLLITGVPYNFATYWKAIGNDSFVSDPQNNQSAAEAYFESIRSTLAKNNLLWGNFIPFKNVVFDDATYALHLQGQFRIAETSSRLNENLKKLSELAKKSQQFNELITGGVGDITDNVSQAKSLIITQFETLAKEINYQVQDLRAQDRSYYIQNGDDIIYETNEDAKSFVAGQGNDTQNQVLSRTIQRRQLRRQVNFLSRRMSYNVRANADNNLFIVDDYYDKDYDLLAFNQELDKIKLFNNEFTSVKDKIKMAKDLLNLEVFCDSQGHIRVRSPQYNRVPSSVFYRMIQQKRANGIQIYPQFIDDLFKTKIESLKEQIELVEDYIRLQCAVLGYNYDHNCVQFIELQASGIVGTGTGSKVPFSFLSKQDSGIIVDSSKIIEAFNSEDPSKSPDLQSLRQQVKTTNDAFSTPDRAEYLVGVLSKKILEDDGTAIETMNKLRSESWIEQLSDRIFDKSGQRVNLNTYISKVESSVGTAIEIQETPDLFQITTELSQKISERQKAIRLYYSTLKNAAEFRSLEDNESLANNLVAPANSADTSIPDVFEHMIEDENYDDYGPGSGSRYIIKRAQIKQANFQESPPEYTSIEVQGTLNKFAPNALPDGFRTFPQGGNALTTAMAVDYDMWRNYGLMQQSSVKVPFLQNPNVQCAPYASMLLSRARKQVLKGNITIAGNEYMQPGEVVYIEDRGLLYYVESVRHSFSFGSDFTTTLSLTYGHAPGEYIPTTLDVMGKMLYNNRDLANLVIHRQSNVFNEKPLGAVQMDKIIKDRLSDLETNWEDLGTTVSSSKNDASVQNYKVITNLLYTVSQFLNNNDSDNSKNKVQVRVYHNDDDPVDEWIKSFATEVIRALEGNFTHAVPSVEDSNVSQPKWLTEKSVEYIEVNLDEEDDPRSPSQAAWNVARDIVESQSTIANGDSNVKSSDEKDESNSNSQTSTRKKRNQLRLALFQNVVDCWLVLDDTVTQEASGN